MSARISLPLRVILCVCLLALSLGIRAAGPATAGAIADGLRERLASADIAEEDIDWRSLRTFYAWRGFEPAWVDPQGPTARAATWLTIIRGAADEGLDPAAYHLAELDELCAARSTEELVSLELRLSDAFLDYALDVNGGWLGRGVDPSWHIAPPPVDPLLLLQSAVERADFEVALRELPPANAGYRRLREALHRYRAIAAQGGWPALGDGPPLELGADDARVPLLRERLRLSGDLPGNGREAGTVFDIALETAVARFQERHGLKADGVVGAQTRAALNVPVEQRLWQIRMSMERWRWLPRDLGSRYLLVNMAGFELLAFEGGRRAFSMKVIIGRRYRSTPAFASQVDALIFNPYWNVPRKLAVLDLLPKQREDPEYFAREGIRVFADWSAAAPELNPADINWGAVDPTDFRYKLRQDPGPRNALGRVKFQLPNRFDVYLHDTPARELFEREVRAFSSGCIRVEEPEQLAAFVVRGDPRWPPARIIEAMVSGVNDVVRIRTPVPIYLLYWTAWVDEDGIPHFYNDIYYRDPPPR